ncbi:MAG: precorrin-2 C(20)-methyltransferase [bacterium]|nr:MAG: precorrin-2 C(20)-methyltransferase [bacterium]
MKPGTLFGIGVGPGDPELITVKGANLLKNCKHLFVPKARMKSESVALEIVQKYVNRDAGIRELMFPMITDKTELEKSWAESAGKIAEVLKTGDDACFVTLGDSYLYSTYIYLVRALRKALPNARVRTVPGVSSFSAAAALTNFPLGEAKEPVTIIPAVDDLEPARKAVSEKGTVVLMKIGKRLEAVLELLEKSGTIDDAVFVSYAGMEGQRIETDLRKLKNENPETGYLSTILVHAGRNNKE